MPVKSVLNVKAVVAAFNQEKALVGAFYVITNLRMDLFEALVQDTAPSWGERGTEPRTSGGGPMGVHGASQTGHRMNRVPTLIMKNDS